MTNDNSSTDTDRLADVLEEHVDAETAEYDSKAPYGRVGTGKTARHVRHARHRADDTESGEFVDPKGEDK